MKRKIYFIVMLLSIIGISAMQSCTEEGTGSFQEYVAPMPDAPAPAVDDVVAFTGSGQKVNLTWAGEGSEPTSWNVYFGTSHSPALVASNVTTNSFTATVNKGGTYYWGVATVDANNVQTESSEWSFQVNSIPAIASGPVPVTNAIDISRSVRLSWIATDPENDELTYDVYLGTAAVPSVIVATEISDTTFAVSKPLALSTEYFWKVVTHDPYGGKSESPVWKFTTTSLPITSFEGDYTADEPAEDYTYDISFVMASPTTITTDNYWNSGWDATFTIDLVAKTYTMTSYSFSTGWTGEESGIINVTTGIMQGTYILRKNGVIQEQGFHTYTKN